MNNSEHLSICYSPTMITTKGIWKGDKNPLDYSLPLFTLQITMVVVMTRILVLILRPFHQPRVVSEIMAGVILGPSVLGRSSKFASTIFPLRSVVILETMANVGLLLFLFLVGVEMDIKVIRRTGKKAVLIAIAGMIIPFLIGIFFSFWLLHKSQIIKQVAFILFLGVALSVTSFPVLARILTELKLINTEIGRIAMSSALFNDMCAWVLLALAIAIAEDDKPSLASLWVIAMSMIFVVFCIFVVRPVVTWIAKKTPEGDNVSEIYVCLTLVGVMVSGFITDAIGTHSIFGAFVFGLVIPYNGPLGVTLIENLEDFVCGLLLPLFFAISGFKTKIGAIEGVGNWGFLLLVTVLASVGKIAGSLAVALYYKMPFYEGVTLGLLMNTKGVVEMVLLNVGKDQNVLDDKTFAIMVIADVVMTGVITPFISMVYKPTARKSVPYKRRTIQRIIPETELRILVCIHTPRNVPTIINLLEASNPMESSPIFVYVLHLIEITGRPSAMLMLQGSRKTGQPTLSRTQAQTDQIISAFKKFEHHVEGISVQTLTAMSPYSTMHEDICNAAEDKRVAMIIIPFHKHQTIDGGMVSSNSEYRTVNQNILENAPCSIGILVDRGLSGMTLLAANHVGHYIAVLFFGGPDDREALAYAWRMSNNQAIYLSVIRFIARTETLIDSKAQTLSEENESVTTANTNVDREKQIDEDYISEFRLRTVEDESIFYMEKEVVDGEQTVAMIRSIDNRHDLFVLGRGQGTISPLTAGLSDWSECPELGPIGDLLASSDVVGIASVLVVQQYVGVESHGGVPSLSRNSYSVHDQDINNNQMMYRRQRSNVHVFTCQP